MPITVEELFERGAHHTAESLLQRGELTYGDLVSALQRRFGPLGADAGPAVADLMERVIAASNAAAELPGAEQVGPLSYGRNPTLPDEYQYFVIGSLPNPLFPGATISVPWTINSPVPLSDTDILDRAIAELNDGFDRADKYMAAGYADMLRRDIAWQRMVREEYGGEAPIDIQIIGAYRRG